MRSSPIRCLRRATIVPAAALLLCACTTLSPLPPASVAATLAGDWQVDPAASEDFDGKLVPLLKEQRERMRPRRSRGLGGNGGGPDDSRAGGLPGLNELDALAVPPEDADKVRTRLANELRPPAKLHIVPAADAVEISGDADPPRRFLTGQTVSRIDASGAANVESGWDQGAFVVRARYTNRGARSWRYQPEANGRLALSFEAEDPEFGKFTLQTRYRRAGAGS